MMQEEYGYGGNVYATQAEVDQAVIDLKNELDNQPTVYCRIKRVTGSEEDGWTVPEELLTDQEILSATDGFYSASSRYASENHMGLTASEMLSKVAEYKILHGQHKLANTVLYYRKTAPTNEDMSGYV